MRLAASRTTSRRRNPVETETNALEEVLDAYRALKAAREHLAQLAEVITAEDETVAETASRALLRSLDDTNAGILNAMRVLSSPRYKRRAIASSIVRIEDDPDFGDADPLAGLE